jgi:ApaG protein
VSKHNIKIEVNTEYLAEQSTPDELRFVFAYHVKIHNEGETKVQLMSRHWIITDGNEKVQEVKGAGVIGLQPKLESGESFQYSSGAVIDTQVGIMQGSYRMLDEEGQYFNAEIPAFKLAIPNIIH